MHPQRIVVIDANVMINLLHLGRLELMLRLPSFEFVVPDHVQVEICDPEQRRALDELITAGRMQLVSITDRDSIACFAGFASFLGRGESACLALAIEHGWTIASDEKRRFRREAEQRIGPQRILGTADLLVLAIRAGLLQVEEADADKARLEGLRFRMPFASIRELLGDG